MTLTDDETGISVQLGYDEDNFPVIYISMGGGFQGKYSRPTVLVVLDDVTVHEMFDEEDNRWKQKNNVNF